MNMLVDTLGTASSHPMVWGAIALIVLHGLYTMTRWFRCPHLAGTAEVSREEAEAELSRPFLAGPRFLITMIGGIGAILAGLALIDANVYPTHAFLLLIAGVFIVQIEPARLRLREAIARVVAAEASGAEAVSIAQKRLRGGHVWLVALNFVLAIAISAGILAF